MIELTSLDVHYLAQELSKLVGAKVEKVVQSDTYKKDLLFTFYLKDWPKIYMRFLLPGLICLHEEKTEYPKIPPGFAMFLRKYFKNTRIKSVEQQGFERVVVFTFTHKDEEFSLIVELIAPGNVVMVLADGKIKGLLENQNFKDRTLRGGAQYEPLPVSFDPHSMSDKELAEKITTSTKNSIVTTLAMTIGLGGVYAEEVCVRAEIEKQRADLKQTEVKKIVAAVKELFSQEIAPHKDDSRAYPFKLKSKSLTPCEDKLFLSALGRFVEGETPVVKEKHPKKARKDKLQTMLDAQGKTITKLEKRSAENRKIAERIFEEYQLMQDILNAAKEARKSKKDVAKSLEKFPQVKKYVAKTAEIEVELDD